MIEIDGALVGRGGPRDQVSGRVVVQIEALLQQALQLVALALRDGAVDRRGMHQQRRIGDADLIVAEAARCALAVRQLDDKIPDRFEHLNLRTRPRPSPAILGSPAASRNRPRRHGQARWTEFN